MFSTKGISLNSLYIDFDMLHRVKIITARERKIKETTLSKSSIKWHPKAPLCHELKMVIECLLT